MGVITIKKIIIILCFILLYSINAFAGDIPESIMLGHQQALFIGEIVGEKTNTYTILPLDVIMGVILEEEITVDKFNYYGNSVNPRIGDHLVAILLEENTIDSLWIFKASSSDYRTLRLLSERYNMVERYEEYINLGKYHEAQMKLDDDKKVLSVVNNQSDIVAQVNTNELYGRRNAAIVGFTILLIAVLVYMFILRKTR